MKPLYQLQQRWFGVWAGSLLTSLLGLMLLNPYLGGGLRRVSYDAPFWLRLPAAPEELEALIVCVDEESHERLDQDYGVPWDPALHARLLEVLSRAGARLVVFDILFEEHRTVDYARLCSAMQAHGGVIVGSRLEPTSMPNGELARVLTLPTAAVLAGARTNGVTEVYPEPDWTVRRLLPLLPGWPPAAGSGSGTNHPTLAWTAAAAAGAEVTRRVTTPPRDWWLNYYGPPGTIARTGYWSLLSNAPPGSLRGKVAFIGERHTALFTGRDPAIPDNFRSPFPTGGRFDGVELHATAFLNLLHGAWLRELGGAPTALLILGSGTILGSLFVRLRPVVALVLAVLAGALVFAAAYAMQVGLRLWFPWAIIVAVQIPVALAWGVIFQATRSYIRSAFLERSLALYLSPRQARNLIDHPTLLRPGGREQVVTILFSDIAGFSKKAERMDAASLLDWVNRYYEMAIGCVHREDGTVLNLIGDAILALWNAPEPQPDHVARACRAALRLQQAVADFDRTTEGLPLRTRTGLHTGLASVGNMGSADHFMYTAIGDAVNVTSRLDRLNKLLRTTVLATHAVVREIEDRAVTRLVGDFRFHGFDRRIAAYEILHLDPPPSPTAFAWVQRFRDGLHEFQRGNFDAAEQAFRDTRLERPDDGPSGFYLEQITRLRRSPPGRGWMGEIDLDER